MTKRRGPQEAHSQTPHKATGRREVPVQKRAQEGEQTVRELTAVGGLRGFTTKELFA